MKCKHEQPEHLVDDVACTSLKFLLSTRQKMQDWYQNQSQKQPTDPETDKAESCDEQPPVIIQ
jgi:hypothetical protein